MVDTTPIPVVARVAPFQRYYVCIDGTPAGDSVEYGRLLEEKFGWRNLLTEFLQPDPNPTPDDTERLHGPNHPFLPICTFKVSGRKKPIAIVCPGGRNGQGLDVFWRNYIGETPEEQADHGKREFPLEGGLFKVVTFGRHTAATKSSLFMNELILVPAIEKIVENGKSFAQIKHGLLAGSRNPTEPDIFAELLIVSSHGWLGGFMRGDNLRPSPKLAEPKEAKGDFFPPFEYFLAGRAALNGDAFFGPKWIILAQCSTVNSATWLMWVKLMAGGLPKVRGILAYEEVSPGVEGSISIAKDFFNRLQHGQPILDSWRKANSGQKWAAIVHKEAVNDLMTRWDVLPELSEAKVTATEGSYLAFGASLDRGKGSENFRNGKEVLDLPPPFQVSLERFVPARPADPAKNIPARDELHLQVTPDTLDSQRAFIRAGAFFRLSIALPAGSRIVSAVVRWVHMRETHSVKPPLSAIFQNFSALPEGSLDLTVSPKEPRDLLVRPPSGPVDKAVIQFTLQSDKILDRSGMEKDHSFLWPLVSIVTDTKGSIAAPFMHDRNVVPLLTEAMTKGSGSLDASFRSEYRISASLTFKAFNINSTTFGRIGFTFFDPRRVQSGLRYRF